jgi:two-component system OmpR family sensor kinase
VRGRFASLTSRLVVTAVALVLATSVLIGVVTALTVKTYLGGQLDDDVRAALQRAERVPSSPFFGLDQLPFAEEPPGDGGPDGDDPGRGQSVGTLTAFFEQYADYDADPTGTLLTQGQRGRPGDSNLSEEVLDRIDELPADGTPRKLDLPGLGSYRIAVSETSTGSYKVAAGLPTDDVDGVVTTLISTEALLILLGAMMAAVAGRSVVRRQLRPLTEVAETAHSVAELPLDSGEIGVTERVPAHLTDVRTEVGQVGAALNTLLAHVETSLDARHASEQRVRQFVADASHELRTPLTTIAGYTELARRRPDDSAAGAMALAKVEEESARMTALVEDLLLLARLDSGRPLEREDVDLTRLLVEAVSDARVLAPEHQWRLELPEDVVEVPGDALRLHQVVTNLLTNARKYTPPGTTVTVTARPDGFTVHDDGPGFPPEIAPHAFERFARADAGRNRAGGVGLGLALVEAITAAHGGTVRLSSEPGDTRIDVRLG